MATTLEVEAVVVGSEEGSARNSPTPPTPEDNSTVRKRKGGKKKKDPSEKSKKPPENKWLQQQIPACRPVFTGLSAFFGFIILGVAFLIIGSIFTAFSSQLRTFEVFYDNDNCQPIETDDMFVRSFGTCEDYLSNISFNTNLERRDLVDCHCEINFLLPEDIRPSWNFYYGMRNYYQNHRRYLNSWDVDQLRGEGFTSPSADCRPFVRLVDPADPESTEKPVVPCGLIANSWFNDSFDSFVGRDMEGNSLTVTLERTNIAWETDRNIRFRNPSGGPNVTEEDLEGTVQPPNWPRDLSEIPQGLQNESLMVWFRISAFPWFKKLYARPAVNGTMDRTLPRGNYTIVLTYNYPVSNFNGRKSIVLTEVNALGGRNLFLGILYLVVGAVLIVVAIVLLLMHKLCSKWKLSKAPFDQ